MGYVMNMQTFCLQDGPGIRTTVFLQGCNLRCYWCHNPESQTLTPVPQFNAARCIGCGACSAVCPQAQGGRTAIFTESCTSCGLCCQECFTGAREMSSRSMEPEEVLEPLIRQKSLFRESGGGVTFSGGEPLLQAEFLKILLRRCREEQIHTAVDSALCVGTEKLSALVPLVDLWLCDLKAIDPVRHRQGTGVDNTLILRNIRYLLEEGAQIILRLPIIPGFNDREADIRGICDYLHTLPRVPPVNLLPFHNWCDNKYTLLGRKFAAAALQPPTKEHMEALRRIFLEAGISDVICSG